MAIDHPARILYDEDGNPVGVLLDGSVYRLQVESKEIRSGTATVTSVAKSTSSVLILASNTSRLGATIFNNSNRGMWLKFGTSATSSDFTVKIDGDFYYEVPFGYTGVLHAAWDVGGSGSALITEVTQ